jgi:hypothetical protein
MALTDLTPTERQQVNEFLRDYRVAMADVVRGLRRQQLLVQAYTQTIAPLWDRIADADVVEDGSGLAGADLTMTKADFTDKFAWSVNLVAAVYSDNGGAVATVWPDQETVDGYGVQLAGPGNVG